jgi:hypothetical protein
MTINFVNNTSLEFGLNGVNKNSITVQSGVDTITCNSNYCKLFSGQATVSFSGINSFVLSSSECAFNIDFSNIGPQSPAIIAGPKQGGYVANLTQSDSTYLLEINYLVDTANIQFINNTNKIVTIDTIIKSFQGPLFKCADPPDGVKTPNSLSCGSNLELSPGTGYASILLINEFIPFRLSASDYVFNVILGPLIALEPISAPQTETNYAVGLHYDNELGYILEINTISNTNSLVIRNSTDETMTMLIDQEFQSLISNPGGSASLVGLNYEIGPGLGYFTIEDGFNEFILTSVGYSYTLDLSSSGENIPLDLIVGANQGSYAGTLSNSGRLYKLVIREIPAELVLEFINLSQSVLSINTSVALGALFSNCEYEFQCDNGFQVSPGYGLANIENLPLLGEFSLNSTNINFSGVSFRNEGITNPSSGFAAEINRIGRLHTILIDTAAANFPGPPQGTLQFFNNTNSDCYIKGINASNLAVVSDIVVESSDLKIPAACNNNNGSACVGTILNNSFPGNFQIEVGDDLAVFEVQLPPGENPTAASVNIGIYNLAGKYDPNGLFYKICIGTATVPCKFPD